MKNLHTLNRYRKPDKELAYYGRPGDGRNGMFMVGKLAVIASGDDGWEHVSVSLRHRTPTWAEMEKIKRLFFNDDEAVMQLHVPPSEHIDAHPHCLHLWRPVDQPIPRPPAIMV